MHGTTHASSPISRLDFTITIISVCHIPWTNILVDPQSTAQQITQNTRTHPQRSRQMIKPSPSHRDQQIIEIVKRNVENRPPPRRRRRRHRPQPAPPPPPPPPHPPRIPDVPHARSAMRIRRTMLGAQACQTNVF